MSVLLLRFLPYIAGFLVVFGAGTWTGYHANPWHNRYTALQSQDAIDRAQGEEAVRKALQTQLAQVQAAVDNNYRVTHELEEKNAAITADRDHTNLLVQRLLARAARSGPSSSGVSQAQNQSGAAPAGGPSGDEGLAKLLGDAHDECERNANRLDSLIAQIRPQL